MAGIADMLVQAGLQTSTQSADLAGASAQGAKIGMELGQTILNAQNQRAQLEQQKQDMQFQKVAKYGEILSTVAKMEPGAARNAVLKNYLPNFKMAMGINDMIPEQSQQIFEAEPSLAPYLISKVEAGEMTYPQLIANANDTEWLIKKLPEVKPFLAKENLSQTINEYGKGLLEAEKNRIQRKASERNAQIAAGKAAVQTDFKNENELREQFNALDVTKETRTLHSAFKKASAIINGKPSVVSDMKLIYGALTAFDPKTGVKEQEFQSAVQAGRLVLPAHLQEFYNKVNGGGLLDDKTRKDFYKQIESSYKLSHDSYVDTRNTYAEIARDKKINPEFIFTDKFTPPPAQEKKKSFKELSPAVQTVAIKMYAKQKNISEEEARKELESK